MMDGSEGSELHTQQMPARRGRGQPPAEEVMDPELVVRAQHGDIQAFEALMLQSHTRLQAVAIAVQQAMLGIWRDIAKLRDLGKFEAWSYRLLIRICHTEAKRRRARQGDIPI